MKVAAMPEVFCLCVMLLFTAGCRTRHQAVNDIHLVTLDPGHFHAALVQKAMYKGVDSTVYVYAPDGPDLLQHLELIRNYNSRPDNPTNWNEVVYRGNDFFEKMLAEKKGNVVVLAGNNKSKTEYIRRLVEEGYNVLSDKPMAINHGDYLLLKDAFSIAAGKKLLLYDIMTERYEITTMLQKEFSMIPDVFGTLDKGSPDNPAVTKESVHHFHKFVSGKVLIRPPWFFDVEQQGEGITDVTTHLIDLVQWECFPEEIINIEQDIRIDRASRFPTQISKREFYEVTGTNSIPDYLLKDLTADTLLNIYCNGEIDYRLKGVYVKISVRWAYKAPEGTGDTHYSILRGTRANLVIRQGKEQGYRPVLYIIPVNGNRDFEQQLKMGFGRITDKYPGLELTKEGDEWRVIIPEKYSEGHEAHFARVTEKYIEYFRNHNMPDWEVPGMLAKYYITTTALEMAKAKTE